MHSFQQKPITSLHLLAERFKRARTDRNLSLEQCAEKINIQKKYLLALESSDYDAIPGDVYARTWIRQYADLLGLDPLESVKGYQEEKNRQSRIEESKPTLAVHQQRDWRSLITAFFTPRILRWSGLGLVGFLIIFYVGLFVYKTFEPPTIVFDQPLTDQKTLATSIDIGGKTEAGVQVWFNDKDILVDGQGHFSQEIPLTDGLNILKIRAKKKHSAEFQQVVQIVHTVPEPTAIATSTGAYN